MTADHSMSPSADVRMRGFARRTTVQAALAWVDGHSPRLEAEYVSVWSAAGRVLAGDVVSAVDVPQFARSMMDGFALRAADTQGATAYNRLPLAVIGQSLPGKPCGDSVLPSQAVRIMTGAPLPAGADAVLPAEQIEIQGDTIFALDEVPPGKNVGRRGEDVSAGTTVFKAGRVLRPQDLGVLSSTGQREISVVRKPRVQLVITGNELLPAGSPADGWQIADANGPMLASLVARDGGNAHMASGGREPPDGSAPVADQPER